MKILANPEISLVQQIIAYRLPHLAIELTVKGQEALKDGQSVRFTNFYFNLSAAVFKPGDGTRFILKDFTIEYTVVNKISWLQKLLSICLVKNIIYQTKSYKEVEKDVLKFFENAGNSVLFLGTLNQSLTE